MIFDFDGTLADSFPWFLRVVNDAARRYGFRPVDAIESERLRHHGAREIIGQLGIPRWKLPLIVRYLRRRKARDSHMISLFPGVSEMLEGLSGAGVTLAVVSSNAESNVRRILGPESAARVDHYECGVSVFGKAPRFTRLLRKSGVLPGRALCVGDEIRDLEAARAAGIDFGAVSWGYTLPEGFAAHAPDELFESPEAIVRSVVS